MLFDALKNFFNSKVESQKFQWFSDIFQIENIHTATINVDPTSVYKKRIRQDGGVIQFPVCYTITDTGRYY